MIASEILVAKPEDLSPGSLSEIGNALRAGGVIAYPTETIYGLGGDVESEVSYRRIFSLKGRPESESLIVLLPEVDWLGLLTDKISREEEKLIDSFWPGPLTIVFKASKKVPGWLASADGRIAVRQTSHFVPAEIMKSFGSPITSTSANPSGSKGSLSAGMVNDYFGAKSDRIEILIDSGETKQSVPSTVVSVSKGELAIHREGIIKEEQLRKALGLK